MAGGQIYGTTSNQYISCRLDWSAVPNIDGNYSTVTATLLYWRNNTGYTTSGTWSGGISIEGNVLPGSAQVSISYNSNTVVLIHQVNVGHNPDGTRDITLSAYGGIAGTSLSSTNLGQVVSLDTIPRTSSATMSKTNFTIEEPVTINISRASSSFKHDINIAFGSNSFNIARGVDTSFTWNTGNNATLFYNQLPNSTIGQGTLWVDTFNGGTKIGSYPIIFTANVPNTIVPVINSVSYSESTPNLLTKFGVYVQNKSKLSVSVSATGMNYSTVKSYSISVNGIVYTTNSFTTDVLKTSGSNTMSVSVTDTRNRTTTTTRTFSVTEYANPQLTTVDIKRCDSTGVIKEDGTALKLVLKGSISPIINKNDRACTLRYKPKNSSIWNSYTVPMSSYVLNNDSVFTGYVFSADLSYDLEVKLADYFTSTISTTSIGTAFTTMDFKSGGKGVAIGKVSEYESLFEVDFQTRINKPLDVIGDTKVKGNIYGGTNQNRRVAYVDEIYPIGAIYISVNNTNPSTYFGGTWVTFSAGRVLVGVNTADGNYNSAEKIGGSYTQPLRALIGATNSDIGRIGYQATGRVPSHDYNYSIVGNNTIVGIPEANINHSTTVKRDDGGEPTTMQPYITVYMWKRTA